MQTHLTHHSSYTIDIDHPIIGPSDPYFEHGTTRSMELVAWAWTWTWNITESPDPSDHRAIGSSVIGHRIIQPSDPIGPDQQTHQAAGHRIIGRQHTIGSSHRWTIGSWTLESWSLSWTLGRVESSRVLIWVLVLSLESWS